MDIITAKYVEAGWTVIRPPKGTINDIIAQKGPKMHFVQLAQDEGLPRHSGLALNTFIQNAFSNGAVPVFARIDGSPAKLTLRDVNTNSRILFRSKKETNLK